MMPVVPQRQASQPIHRAPHRSRDLRLAPMQFGISHARWNRLKRSTSAIPDPLWTIRCGPRFEFSHSTIAERFYMTLTTAHISPIISVIAGLLILIMPRLLNLVVAIFLILNGLIGLGLLKWLHI
jgi:Protein of unknown function (DUF3096)